MKNIKYYSNTNKSTKAFLKIGDKIFNHLSLDCKVGELINNTLELELLKDSTDNFKDITKKKTDFIMKHTDLTKNNINNLTFTDFSVVFELVEIGFKIDKFDDVFNLKNDEVTEYKFGKYIHTNPNQKIKVLLKLNTKYENIINEDRISKQLVGMINFIENQTNLTNDELMNFTQGDLNDLFFKVYRISNSVSFYELIEKNEKK